MLTCYNNNNILIYIIDKQDTMAETEFQMYEFHTEFKLENICIILTVKSKKISPSEHI